MVICNNRTRIPKGQSRSSLPRCDHYVQDVIYVSAMTQMPKIQFTSITTQLHITAFITIISPVCLPESGITKCGSGKEVVYVLPITSILRRLPLVRAGDTGTIPFGYRNGCRNGAHRYNHYLASADSSRGAGDCCPTYFVNSWALGLSRYP